METTELLRAALSFLLLYLLVKTGKRLNTFGEEHYGFRPVAPPHALLAILFWIFPVVGFNLLPHAPVLGMMLTVAVIPTILSLFHSVRLKSGIGFALAVTTYLVAANILLVAVLPLMRDRDHQRREIFCGESR